MIPLDMVEQMPLHLFSSGVPVISRLGSPRGHNGSMIDSILCTYAAMNDHDAFITPTHSIKDFYAQHVLDTDCFHVIPNGVDSDLFRPMDKAQARSQVAERLNRPEITNQKIVGFFGRFQSEKGAGIFIKIAKMLPDVLFFVVAPTLHAYQLQKLPPNLIYIGEQPPRDAPVVFIVKPINKETSCRGTPCGCPQAHHLQCPINSKLYYNILGLPQFPGFGAVFGL